MSETNFDAANEQQFKSEHKGKRGEVLPKADTDGNVSLKMSELVALIGAAVDSAVTKSSQVIADALIEARKPYVDPRQQENERKMRDSMREVQDRINRQIAASKEFCPHVQGSNELSEVQGTLGSFVTHTLDTGEVIGICTNCQKIIRSTIPEDRKWFSKKNANRMSKAGQRNFLDPQKAQLAGRLVDEPAEPVAA